MTVTEIVFVIVVSLLIALELIGITEALIVGRSNRRGLKELRERIERIEQDRRRG